MSRIPSHAPPLMPPAPPPPDPGAGGPGAVGGLSADPAAAGGAAAPGAAPATDTDRIDTAPPTAPPLGSAAGALWRPLLARVAFSRGDDAADMASSLEAVARDPRGELMLLGATADGPAFGQALDTEAARLGLGPAAAERARYVTAGVVSKVLGQRVRVAAVGQLTAKIKQVDHLARVMRGQVHDPAALTAFFKRFGAVPATAREAVLDAHHLGVAGHLTGDPTLYIFSRSRAGAKARAELLATGHTEILGTPVSLSEMADGLETLRGELEAAKDYAWKAKEPLLVFRPLVRRLAASDPRYAEAFSLRRWVTGGVAIADPAREGIGIDAWRRLTGRDATLAKALWTAGVADHGEVTHARHAWHARLAGQIAALGLGLEAMPKAAAEELGLSVEARAERAVADAAERILTRPSEALVARLGRRAAEAELTAKVRAEAERLVTPALKASLAQTLGPRAKDEAGRLLNRLVRPLTSAVGNWISRAASRAVAQGLDALAGGADPRSERILHHLGHTASQELGTYLGGPGQSLGGLVAGYLATETRGLDDPDTAIVAGYRWDGGVPGGSDPPGR